MGGCATKPKGLKPEAVDAPAPEPTPVKEEEEEAATVSETKGEIIEAVKKVEGDNDDGEKVDEQGNKRRSLSLLFKENEEGKESTEDDKMPSERKEAPPETEKTTEASKQTPAPDVAHESKTDESEQTPTPEVAKAAPATEIRKPESSEEKKTEEVEGEGNAAKNVKV